jgi:hypothetical protein
MRASKHSIPKTALALAAAIAIPSVARASLTIDVQLPTGGKSAVVSGAGEQVQLQVFAVVTGTNATGADDGLQIAQGSFLSTGALQGSLAASVIAPFTGVGSAGGSVSDLDSDGDADVGSNNNAAARASGSPAPIRRSHQRLPRRNSPIPASSLARSLAPATVCSSVPSLHHQLQPCPKHRGQLPPPQRQQRRTLVRRGAQSLETPSNASSPPPPSP